MSSLPGSGGRELNIAYTDSFAEVATRETGSAPIRLTAAKATLKSIVDMRRYTPSAYQPYDLIKCFRRCENVSFDPPCSGSCSVELEERRGCEWWKKRKPALAVGLSAPVRMDDTGRVGVGFNRNTERIAAVRRRGNLNRPGLTMAVRG